MLQGRPRRYVLIRLLGEGRDVLVEANTFEAKFVDSRGRLEVRVLLRWFRLESNQ